MSAYIRYGTNNHSASLISRRPDFVSIPAYSDFPIDATIITGRTKK